MENTNLLNKNFDLIEFTPIGILVFDVNFNIVYINKNFQKFGVTYRFPESSLINQNILSKGLFFNETVIDLINNLKINEPFEKELYSNKKSDGTVLKVMIKGAPIISNHCFNGGILIIDDFVSYTQDDCNNANKTKLITNVIDKINLYWIITDLNGQLVSTSNEMKGLIPHKSYSIYDLFLSELKDNIEDIYLNIGKVYQNTSIELHATFGSEQKIFNAVFLIFNDIVSENPLVYILLNDITNQKLYFQDFEYKLHELNKLQIITKHLSDAIINLDENGYILSIIKNQLKFFEKEEYIFVGKFIGELIPIINKEYFDILLKELKKKKFWISQLRFQTDESTLIILDTKVLLLEEANQANLILICNDASEGYLLEKEIKSSEEHYRSIVTNSKEFICTFDLNGNITYVNPHFSNIFKIKYDDATLLNLIDLIDKTELQIENFDFTYISKKEVFSLELPLRKMDGRKIFVSANFTPVMDLQNRPQYYIGIFSDISIQKESEKDFLLIKTVFEASKDGIAVESENTFQIVNDSFANIFGYSDPQEIIGKNPVEFIDKSARNNFINILESVINNEGETNRFEITGIKKNGEKITCEYSLGNYKIGKNYSIVMLVRDITLEKAAQDALQISEERYRSITENINEFIWVAERVEKQIKAVLYTAAAYKITSYAGEEFISDPKLWYKIIHPNDLGFVIAKLKKLYHDPTKLADEVEYRIINNIGNIIWIKNKINVIREVNGDIIKLFGLVSDISITKNNEEELKNYADSLKTLNDTKDRFLSIISHDLRTPFSSILGFTDILLGNRKLSEEKQVEYISFIQDSSKSMLSLVNSLLDWTRIQTGRIEFIPERLNAKSLVTKSIQTLSGVALQKGINILVDIEKDIHIHADENLLFQVFNNLISNAVKFCKKDDTITISAKRLVDKKQIRFSIKDTGVGIKPEDVEKLFKIETKFTLKGTSGEKGSGLGLSLVSDIVKKHGGDIWVESEFGKGSDFIFTCPVSSTNILLVDDIKTDRILYAKLLKSVLPDYNIIEASNGKEAFDQVKQLTPALIITDHGMPEMNGIQLVEQIKNSKLKFKPPVIVLSSDLTESIINDYKRLDIDFVFYKPVNLTTFKFAIEKSLKKAIFT